jgi:assimilatory nitrate reductase catalytic subunit
MANDPSLAVDRLHAGVLEPRGISSGDLARLSTRRGALIVRVEASESIRSGQAFMPMHWGS